MLFRSPNPNVAVTSFAFAGESAYGAMLHVALTPQIIHVLLLIFPGAFVGVYPLYAPDALADQLWNIHAQPGPFQATVSGIGLTT